MNRNKTIVFLAASMIVVLTGCPSNGGGGGTGGGDDGGGDTRELEVSVGVAANPAYDQDDTVDVTLYAAGSTTIVGQLGVQLSNGAGTQATGITGADIASSYYVFARSRNGSVGFAAMGQFDVEDDRLVLEENAEIFALLSSVTYQWSDGGFETVDRDCAVFPTGSLSDAASVLAAFSADGDGVVGTTIPGGSLQTGVVMHPRGTGDFACYVDDNGDGAPTAGADEPYRFVNNQEFNEGLSISLNNAASPTTGTF